MIQKSPFREREGEIGVLTPRQKENVTLKDDRQTDRQTNTEADRQADRQAEILDV